MDKIDMTKCPVIKDEWKHYDPCGNLIITTNTLHCLESLYLRAEIGEKHLSGYYILHNDRRINIQPSGNINMTVGELKDTYSDLMMEQLLRLNKCINENKTSIL